MKSLMLLWQELARECGQECTVSTVLDEKTVEKRYEHEGLSFLAITLPQFGKDFERGLDQGCFDRSALHGFKWRGGLPAFLGGFLDLVFCRNTGMLLENPDIASIHAVRQLTLLFGKVEAPASDKRRNAAIERFIECEQEVKDAKFSGELLQEFLQVSHLLYGGLLQRADRSLYMEHNGWTGEQDRPEGGPPAWPYIHPKHGPGATADRLGGNAKFDLCEWPESLERVFHYCDYAVPNHGYSSRGARVDYLEPGRERAAKLTDVPKTLKTPRLIAKEPTAKQYMQQAVKGLLVESIQKSTLLDGMIGFDDQEVNHQLAKMGSLNGSLATLDLSEASDRVSNSLVETLFSRWFHVDEAVTATRSRKVEVPGHGVVTLAKFASMGSALTFPVEAMVFLTIVFVGIQREHSNRLSERDVKSLRSQVRVYGDDIIIPVRYVKSVVESLEAFGLRVNNDKSFWTGKFRESCGKEYYAGSDVSIVRVRHLVANPGKEWTLPTHRKHVQETESLVSLRNRFYCGGMWQTAKWLDSWIGSLLGGSYPTCLITQDDLEAGFMVRFQGLARWSLLDYQVELWNWRTQSPLVRAWLRVFEIPDSPVSEIGGLTKVYSYRGEEPLALDHLEHAGRPTSSTLKRRWIQPC